MADEVLVRRAQTGDVDAVEQLLLAHLPGVVRMLRRLLPAPADAEEVAQEACLHALIGLPGLRRPELFGSWLRTIAHNRAMQWQRRRYAEAAAWPRLWESTADRDSPPEDRYDYGFCPDAAISNRLSDGTGGTQKGPSKGRDQPGLGDE